MTHDERMARFEAADLYVVITESFCGGRPALDILDAVLDAGVTLIQYREKDLSAREHVHRAEAFRKRTAEAGALLIVNDRTDVALAVGADGVHLGRCDLPIPAARRIDSELIIGASSHSMDQALQAQDAGASYVNIGPIFETRTKETSVPPMGPEIIAEIAPRLTIPFTCMGGIKANNIEQVLKHGARHPAVVTAVTQAPNPRKAAEELRATLLNPAKERSY